MSDNKATAPTPQKAAAKTIKARVIGRYGGHPLGSVIDVDPREIKICPHALIALDDEPVLAEKAKASVDGQRTDTALFRATRSNGRASRVAMAESIKQRKIAELTALGLVVTQKVAG